MNEELKVFTPHNANTGRPTIQGRGRAIEVEPGPALVEPGHALKEGDIVILKRNRRRKPETYRIDKVLRRRK